MAQAHRTARHAAPMTAADLRARVVLRDLNAVTVLAIGLYALIGFLLWSRGADAVPDALWLAAGIFGQALTGWLNNSKGGVEGGTGAGAGDPTTFTAPPDAAVTVTPQKQTPEALAAAA
jgi:hypothetical protein